ncbi:MAG: methyltransferase domain-containing protein [Bacillota bacterium]
MRPRLLVLACDALDPDLLLTHLDRLPQIASLCQKGGHGVVESFTHSCDIWTTYYTGLPPAQHGVQAGRLAKATGPADLSTVKTDLFLWDWLNQAGLTAGFVEPLHAYPAPKINGFFVSGQPRPPLAQTELAVHPPALRALIDREYFADIPRPLSLAELGITTPFRELTDQQIIAALQGYFQDYPERLRSHLEWYAGLILKLYARCPVDVVWAYFLEPDIIGHFGFHERPPATLIRSYQEIDRAIGHLVQALEPESVLLLSDHGVIPLATLLTEPQTTWPMRSLAEEYRLAGTRQILPDLAVVEGFNKGLCTGAHRDRAFWAAAGPLIRQGVRADIHFHDVFRLVVRTLGLPVPEGRAGQTPDVFLEFAGKRADSYDRLSWAAHQGYLGAFLDFARLEPHHHALEVGVGTGQVAEAAHTQVARLVGIDHSPEMLEIARTKLPAVELLEGDLRSLPFADRSFDRVLARSVLHHLTAGLAEAVRECFRVLAPGGELVIGEGIPPSAESVAHFIEVFRLKEERLVLMPEHLVRLLESVGFVDLRYATYVMDRVSVRNWLDQTSLPPALRAQLLEMHRTTPPAVQQAYRTLVTEDDVLIDFTFALISGRRPSA